MPEIPHEQFADTSVTPNVRGFLHRPANPNGGGIVLTHGAGANCRTELLRDLAEVFAGAGFMVLRTDLPFRQKRPSGPPGRGDAKNDQMGLKHAIGSLKKLNVKRCFLGGHSYGGRQSTILCASEPKLVEGLLLLSYPLHPPVKPTDLRTQHFPHLHTPAMFVHGSRDGFGSLSEMQAALKLIPAKTLLLPVESAGHDLKSKSVKVPDAVLSAFVDFFGY
jgi:predicted alpha/beta-hydrolase family hydrolase